MRRIRLGVVGTGLAFSELHVPALMGMQDRFRIVAVCNRSEARSDTAATRLEADLGERPAVYRGPDELLMLSDAEAVLICVPIADSASIVAAALGAGKHVFVEKPLADTVSEFERMLEIARTRNLVVVVGENFRHQRPFHQARELIESGAIGKPLVYRLNDMHYTAPDSKYAATEWRREGRHKGGYLVDGGTHIVAGMRTMVGRSIESVHGLLASFNPEVLSGQPDTMLMNIVFEGALIGQIALGYGAFDPDARRPKVYGAGGTLVMFPDRFEIWRHGAAGGPRRVEAERNGGGFTEEWLDFYGALALGQALRGDPREALEDLRVIEAGILSARTGACVSLR